MITKFLHVSNRQTFMDRPDIIIQLINLEI